MFYKVLGSKSAFVDICIVLFILLLQTEFVDGVKCNSCKGDFVSVGRHYWRCKARISSSVQDIASSDETISDNIRIITQQGNGNVQNIIQTAE